MPQICNSCFVIIDDQKNVVEVGQTDSKPGEDILKIKCTTETEHDFIEYTGLLAVILSKLKENEKKQQENEKKQQEMLEEIETLKEWREIDKFLIDNSYSINQAHHLSKTSTATSSKKKSQNKTEILNYYFKGATAKCFFDGSEPAEMVHIIPRAYKRDITFLDVKNKKWKNELESSNSRRVIFLQKVLADAYDNDEICIIKEHPMNINSPYKIMVSPTIMKEYNLTQDKESQFDQYCNKSQLCQYNNKILKYCYDNKLNPSNRLLAFDALLKLMRWAKVANNLTDIKQLKALSQFYELSLSMEKDNDTSTSAIAPSNTKEQKSISSETQNEQQQYYQYHDQDKQYYQHYYQHKQYYQYQEHYRPKQQYYARNQYHQQQQYHSNNQYYQRQSCQQCLLYNIGKYDKFGNFYCIHCWKNWTN